MKVVLVGAEMRAGISVAFSGEATGTTRYLKSSVSSGPSTVESFITSGGTNERTDPTFPFDRGHLGISD